ncbi:MAG: valine--tRNA ligase [Myxococcales bacterium]|nr:valine--tRNA ligase [Myxococcales bacterium]
MSGLASHYDPKEVEPGLDEAWETGGYYRAESVSEKPAYCICIPPPNVTGVLHMGHALVCTIQDILTRYKRMDGYNTLWLPGTDHAGIATQMVVERELATEGKSRFDLGREKFLERTFEWKETYRDRIVNQMRRLGVSVDWSRERFTLDEGYCEAVRTVFVQLYKEGLIYKDHRLVNWSPGIQTVLSDLEIDYKEMNGHLWYMRYPLADDPDVYVTVATTRPETMLGDTAVAVHPEDPRHKDLIGRDVLLPLVGRRIPIIGDDVAVDLEFGTGAVKITPAHDFNDFETGKRNDLEKISILTDEASLNDNVPEEYRGLDRLEARKKIVADLDALGLLEKVEDHVHSVGHCQRTGIVVEPMLSDQWFVRIQPLAEPAIDAVRTKDIRFVPETWEKTYFNWMENIRDWCISRQLWWGHRIPVWYCRDCGAEICEMTDPTTCSSCEGTNLQQDRDVLDTWFSSGLWPFATLGWPEETDDLKTFYPNTVMETGFDIIFFWVARMIMMGHKFMGESPFSDVYLHAMVRDEHGEKMSKTKGNVIDPLDVVDEHGADALRFTLAMMAGQGRDIKLNVSRVEGYRNFCNKLWNATRFVAMSTEGLDEEGYQRGLKAMDGHAEQWILHELDTCIEASHAALEDYRFNDAASATYQFAWHVFCDWYVELAKHPLRNDDDPAGKEAVQAALLYSLETMLRLLHPMMPHVTERLWGSLPDFVRGNHPMLIVADWPHRDARFTVDQSAVQAQEHVNAMISAIRNVRAERQVSHKTQLVATISCQDSAMRAGLEAGADQIRALCRLAELHFDSSEQAEPTDGAALSLVDGAQLLVEIPLDEQGKNEEQARLDKEISRCEDTVSHIQRKLNNPNFVDRAPDAVVERERARLEAALEELSTYQQQRSQLD